MHYFRKLLLCLLLCLPLAGVAAEDMRTEVINLKHRTVEQMMPVLKPLLPPGSVVTGQNYTLIVKTTPAHLVTVRKMLQQLDKAAKTLLVSVKQGTYKDLEASDSELYRTVDKEDQRERQRVKVLDGQAAFINTGQDIPVVISYGYDTAGIDYKPVRSGFQVVPHLLGDKVRLVISKQREQLNRYGEGRVDVDSVETVLVVPLGKWVELGGTSQDFSRTEDSIWYRSGDRHIKKSIILLRVDIAHD